MPQETSTAQEAAVVSIDDGVCGTPHGPDHAFHKRCEHYRHKHVFHRGKAGSAQLAARGMIDVTGASELDVTTGTFDDGSVPPGALDEIDISIMRTSRKHHDDLTFKPRPAKGFFSASLGKIKKGQPFTVNATVTGIDKGADHVSVSDEFQYRPDLAVSHIQVPSSAPLGLPTSIAATVSEKMGDMGAKADCLLSADGTVVDRATGIWVDAGGVVTCHFSYGFTTPGQHALHVAVTNVQPGDYDMSNNGADATVLVSQQFLFSGTAYDSSYNGVDAYQVLDTAGNVLYNENDTWSGSLQSVSLSGSWATPVTFPLANVSASATSGGATWALVNLPTMAADSTDPVQGTCAAGSDTAGFNWITVCTTASNGGATSVNVSEFAGDVTYHSDGACMQTTSLYDCQGGYTWNSDTDSPYATRHPLSGSLTVNVGLSDAAGATLQAAPVIPLTSYVSQYSQPVSCDPQVDQTQYCQSHQYLETGLQGSVGQ